MLNGAGSGALAEKLKLSIPRPWALPDESVICHTSHNAAPGGQFVIVWFNTLRLVWFCGNVPSTATPPTSPGTVGIVTFNAGINAVVAAGKPPTPVWSM